MLNLNLTKINVCKYESIKPIFQHMGGEKREKKWSLFKPRKELAKYL